MGFCLTLIELIGGLIFIKGCGIKIWDYSDRWGNYKGLICPLFTFIWTFIGGIYYYFIADHLLDAIKWFDNNISFSYILGLFSGILFIDIFYSTNLLNKIKDFTLSNNIIIKLIDLKKHLGFKLPNSIKDTLNNIKAGVNKK